MRPEFPEGVRIPTFLFHRIGPRQGCSMTVSVEDFSEYLDVIQEAGYKTLTVRQLADLDVSKGLLGDSKVCLLTFDDGTLDFWTYAAPLLKERGMAATVFLVSDRLCGNDDQIRPSLDDYWNGQVELRELYQLPDFHTVNRLAFGGREARSAHHLSWNEVRALHRTGLFDFQGHSMDHGTHFCSSKILGFKKPLNHWTLEYAAKLNGLGSPIYEVNSTLVGPRFLGCKDLQCSLEQMVQESGGARFFERHDWHQILRNLAFKMVSKSEGHYEDTEVWRQKVLMNFITCDSAFVNELGMKPISLGWPFGRCSDESVSLAELHGFDLGFVAKGSGITKGQSRMKLERYSVKGLSKHQFAAELICAVTSESVNMNVRYDHPLGFPRDGLSP